MAIQLGNHVRFRAGMAPGTFKRRERDVGVVVALDGENDADSYAMVQFETSRSAISPVLLEVVGAPAPARDNPEGVS